MGYSSAISDAFVNQNLLTNSFNIKTNGSFADLTQSLLQPNTDNLSTTSTSTDLAAIATQSLLGATFGYTQDNTISTLTQSILSSGSQAVSISQTAQQISDLYNKVRSSNNTNAVDGMNTIISDLVQNNQAPLNVY